MRRWGGNTFISSSICRCILAIGDWHRERFAVRRRRGLLMRGRLRFLRRVDRLLILWLLRLRGGGGGCTVDGLLVDVH